MLDRRGLTIGVLALGVFTLCLAVETAQADTIRLKSGQVIVVQAVEVMDGRFRMGVERDGTVTQVDIAFEKLAPKTVLRVFDRYTDKQDPQRKLESAQLALRFGLIQEARDRFERASQMDATLKPKSKAGLLAVGKQEATGILLDLETRLRKNKNPVAELAGLEALLTGPHAEVLTPTQRKRIAILIRLAKQVIAREEARKAKPPAPAAPPKKDDDEDPPQEGDPNIGRGRTYADERYRSRAPHRRGGPNLPGASRPPIRTGGGTPRAGGGGSSSGGRSGAPNAGGARSGGGGNSSGGGGGGSGGLGR